MTGDEAQATLQAVAPPPAAALRALRAHLKLSDSVLGRVVGRSAQTVRRWRNGKDDVEIPDRAALAIDDLRVIAAMLLGGGFDGSAAKAFLLSRNTGLGLDRPIDGVRADRSAFRRVEHVTACFIEGVVPEPGSALDVREGQELEPAPLEPPIAPDGPHEPPSAPDQPPEPVGVMKG